MEDLRTSHEIVREIEKRYPIHVKSTPGQKYADRLTGFVGSWRFIIAVVSYVILWVALNLYFAYLHWSGAAWDPYPFILLNLMFSVQAAYAAPIIMMSQNRQAERDRYQAQADFDTNVKAETEIEDIQAHLHTIEATLERMELASGEARSQ